ncbi:MAG: outer rane receptor for ferrienterochelin and colicin [Ferruginibacter sp.]|nr:outer rane receptor for ferrienterochelin and colicin [Ferruginibacter sp.]
MLLKRLIPLVIAMLSMPFLMNAQVTTSSMNGTVKGSHETELIGATIKAVHTPTGTVYTTPTRKGGVFYISNMNPGGPYTVTISSVGYKTLTREGINLSLGETLNQTFELVESASSLTEVVVSSTRALPTSGKGGSQVSVGRDKMANLPTIGRTIQDFVRFVPQAKITAADGGISIAGQNNRYNSFYIDGAANNDLFGLSNSGTNGGQTGTSPISIDAIDQFQVLISPYDASIGNFTGGGINAITRSGTNKFEGSAYYVFRNQDLAGKSPVATLKSGSTTEFERTKLPAFQNKTTGIRIGGAIVKNKLFYFLLAEIQRDDRPQPFGFANYTGASNRLSAVDSLANFLKTKYGYDPGSYLDNPEKVQANRYTGKIDWNLNNDNKLSVSYRYNKSFRNNVTASNSTNINFYNNGYVIPNTTQSGTLEFRSSFKNGSNNRFLFTLTDVNDDRGPLNSPFPRVTITDGSGRFVFGTEPSSTQNLLKTTNYAIQDAFKFNLGKNSMTIGTDNELTKAYNVFIQNSYGTYTFTNLKNFYDNANGIVTAATGPGYTRGIALLDGSASDETKSAANFNVARLGFYINDELKANENLTFNFGLRADKTSFLTDIVEDKFFNDSAIAVLSKYHDLQGARSGQKPNIPWSFSPRIGFTYKLPSENLVIRGGLGLFTGRIPLVWPGGIYNNNGVSVGAITRNASNAILFKPDAFGQYTPQDFGLNPNRDAKGSMNLIAKDFKLNKIFRTSLAADQKLGNNWSTTIELIVSKNLNEINYQNVNIFPNRFQAVGADNRQVNDTSAATSTASALAATIPIRASGTRNPYTDVLILQNTKGEKGFSYTFTFTIDRAWRQGFAFNANYAFGNSLVINEGTSSVNTSQYRFMEAVNGQNNLTLSNSDFDAAHRITAYFAKKFTYANKKLATTISMTYQGQSGTPFSYVYQNSIVKAYGRTETNDLIFIPTTAQLQTMIFDPNLVSGVTYTAQQQRDMFDAYITKDKYLSKHRGEYSERNGARLPFTHLLNLKLQQDFIVKLAGRDYGLQLSYDVFNFANMIDHNAGKQYFLSNDQYSLVTFNGFVSSTNLTPKYRFSPQIANNGNPYGLSTSSQPDYSARWISSITARINF